MDFINNWQAELTSTLPTGSGIALPVPPAALARLSGGVYLLTLFDGDAVEIIRFNGPTGEIEARGLEGTPARAWPADTVIYAALTAGQLTGMLAAIQQLEGSVASLQQQVDECCQVDSGGLTDQNGNTLIDQNGNILEA